jgi:hypothetical protein
VKKGLLAVATVAALLTVAIPAQATVRDHEHYAQPYSDDFDACGFSIHTEGLATGNARIRVGKRDLDTAFFGLDNYAYSETWTNTANGRTLSIWGDAIIRDVSASHVEGSIFRFTTVESGRPFNLADASGNVLIRDRGAIRQTYLFDTEGDHTPGGIFLDLLEERVSGPHPGFFMSEDEFCAVVTPLLS